MSRQHVLGYLFALAAAAAWGIAAVVIRKGVTEAASPLGGAVVSLLFGCLVLGLMNLGQYRGGLRQQRRAIGLFVISGLASGFGVANYFLALNSAPVVVVSPVANTSPVVALAIVQVFLGHLERITLRVWLGGLLVVAGVALVSVGQYL